MQNRLNPDNTQLGAQIRDQEKRLVALDIAARTYPGLGRHDGIVKYAVELLAFVNDGTGAKAAGTAVATAAAITIEQALAVIPKELLRSQKELAEKGLKRADVIAAARERAGPAAQASDDAGQIGEQGNGRDRTHDVGTVQDGGESGRLPASMRQAGG